MKNNILVNGTYNTIIAGVQKETKISNDENQINSLSSIQ